MSHGVGHRLHSDAMLLWLWGGLAATALIRSLAWEPPYFIGVALKSQKTKIKDKKKKDKCNPNAILNIVIKSQEKKTVLLPFKIHPQTKVRNHMKILKGGQ